MGTANMPVKHEQLPPWLQPHVFADLGVRIFFVISGFLITTLLFTERERRERSHSVTSISGGRSGSFPAFYFYLAVIILLAQVGFLKLLHGDVLAAATYTMNYHRRGRAISATCGRSPSKSSSLLRVARGRDARQPTQRDLGCGVRDRRSAADSRWHVRDLAEPPRGIGETFPSVFDSIAAGCLLAGAREILAKNRVYAAVLRSPFFVLVPLFDSGGDGASCVLRLRDRPDARNVANRDDDRLGGP